MRRRRTESSDDSWRFRDLDVLREPETFALLSLIITRAISKDDHPKGIMCLHVSFVRTLPFSFKASSSSQTSVPACLLLLRTQYIVYSTCGSLVSSHTISTILPCGDHVLLSLTSSTPTTGLIGSDVNRICLGTFFGTRYRNQVQV
jgi:hypothetical protein